jgi:hypothetical protein
MRPIGHETVSAASSLRREFHPTRRLTALVGFRRSGDLRGSSSDSDVTARLTATAMIMKSTQMPLRPPQRMTLPEDIDAMLQPTGVLQE